MKLKYFICHYNQFYVTNYNTVNVYSQTVLEDFSNVAELGGDRSLKRG